MINEIKMQCEFFEKASCAKERDHMRRLHRYSIDAFLFSNPPGFYEYAIREQMIPKLSEHCHQALLLYPQALSYVHNNIGISLANIERFKIGFFHGDDTLVNMSQYHAYTLVFNKHCQHLSLYEKGDLDALYGCITLPINYEDGSQGIFGLRIVQDDSHIFSLVSSTFGVIPVYMASGIEKTAIMCEHALDVIALEEHGYANGIAQAGTDISELTFDAMFRHEATIMVYFTHVSSTSFDISKAEQFAAEYHVALCEVNLPFKVTKLGLWDEFQWRLFDKRLTSALDMINVRNERHQA